MFDDRQFDDSAPQGAAISIGYGGLTWTNFYEVNPQVMLANSSYVNTGYLNGMISSPNVAYNGFGSPAAFSSEGQFTLESFYLSAAWETGLNVTVVGKFNGATTHSATFVVDPFCGDLGDG